MKNKMFKLKFKSVSKIAVSPRSSKALYRDIDFDNGTLNVGKEKISIIYPFYSYNERKINMSSKSINYYLPGSSIKGALFSKEKNIMCDDIRLKSEHITLDWIYKVVDYNKTLEQSTPKYDKFFENTGIEMLKPEVNFEAIVRVCNNEENIVFGKMIEINKKTMKKFDTFITEIKKVLENIKDNKKKKTTNPTKDLEENSKLNTIESLEEILNKIENTKKEYEKKEAKKIIAFLGGFKGKAGTISDIKEDIETGLYFDNETKLPYGLVEVEIL